MKPRPDVSQAVDPADGKAASAPSSRKSPPPLGARTIWAATLYAVLFLLTVAAVLTGDRRLLIASAVVGVPYIALVLETGIWRNAFIGGALLLAGIVAPLDPDKAWAALLGGTEKTLPLLVMFGAALALRYPALHSPSMTAVGEWIGRQPKGRRFLVVSLASLAFAWVLNQASVVLMVSFVRYPVGSEAHRRMMNAILRGFMGAVTWSPLFVGMAIILPLVPGSSYLKVVPLGILTTVVFIASAWMIDRLTRRRADPVAAPVVESAPPVGGPLLRVAGVFVALAGCVILAFEAWHIPITIAIGLVATPIAVAWQLVIVRGGRRNGAGPAPSLRPFGRHLLSLGSSLGNETVLFMGANTLGVGAALALNSSIVAEMVDLLPASLSLRTAVLIVIGIAFSAVGLHPVVIVVLIGEAFSPQVLGMPPDLMATTLLAIWCLGTAVSPFGAVNMQIARFSGVTPYRVALLWNGPFVLLMAALVAPLLAIVYNLIY